MTFQRREKRGQSVIEFTAVIMLLLAVFFVFQKYLIRGFSGRWKGVGDAIGQGRIYDPEKTIECAYVDTVGWYDRICYEDNCKNNCGLPDTDACKGCIRSSCINTLCN